MVSAERYGVLIALLFPVALHAWNPGSEWLQLRQENLANQQALDRMQDSAPDQGSTGWNSAQNMVRQQKMAQRLLQESQRRNQLIFNQRARTGPSAENQWLRSNAQQQRNFQEQRFQLNRFRMQRLLQQPRPAWGSR